MAMAKCTQTDKFRRLETVEEMLADGTPDGDICKYMRQEWGVGRATAWRYISEILGRWVKEGEKDSGKNRDRAIRTRQKILKKCMEQGKIADAHRWQEGIEKLQGLLVERHEHSGNIGLDVTGLLAEQERWKKENVGR